jgi:two-component system NarL family response regulator
VGKIRIVTVDEHEVVLVGLRRTLDLEPDMEVVGEARTGEEAVRLTLTRRPDIVLLETKLPDMDGPEVCKRVLVQTNVAVVMLTGHLQYEMISRSMTAGARGYVLKDVEIAELKNIVRSIHRGNSFVDPAIASRVIAVIKAAVTAAETVLKLPFRQSPLSETDVAIIRHVAHGLGNDHIAALINLSPDTVEDRLEKIAAALRVRSRTEIVAGAIKAGLV